MATRRGRGHAAIVADALISRSAWEALIDEWVFSERDRYILKRHLLDGVRYSQLIDELDERYGEPLSERRITAIVRAGVSAISKHL